MIRVFGLAVDRPQGFNVPPRKQVYIKRGDSVISETVLLPDALPLAADSVIGYLATYYEVKKDKITISKVIQFPKKV